MSLNHTAGAGLSIRLSVLGLVVMSAAALAGCAATVGRPTAVQPKLDVPADASKKIVMVIDAPTAVRAQAEWQDFREEWQTSMNAAASGASTSFSMLSNEAAAPAAPATLVRVKVNDFRYVSQAKRYAIGVFGGNASMDVDVDFVALPSKRLLGTRKYATSSSAWEGVFSAMTPKQVQAVSIEIVKEVTPK